MNTLINLTVDKDKEVIYVLDVTGKIVGFNMGGEPIFETASEQPRSKNLVSVGDEFWIANESPSSKTHLIGLDASSREKQEIGPEQKFENVLFSPFKRSGNLYKDDDQVLLTMPYGDTLYKISSSAYNVERETIDIPDFKMTEHTQDRQVYLNDSRQMKKFFSKNSTITGLFNLENGYAFEVLHIHKDHRRVLVLTNNAFETQCFTTLTREYEGIEDPRIRFSDGKNLYFYREEVDKNDNVSRILSFYEPECL